MPEACWAQAGSPSAVTEPLASLWVSLAEVRSLFPTFLEEGQILFEESMSGPAAFCSTGGSWREPLCAGTHALSHTHTHMV